MPVLENVLLTEEVFRSIDMVNFPCFHITQWQKKTQAYHSSGDMSVALKLISQ